MGLFLTFLIFLQLICQAISQCAQNAQGTAGNCLCIQGYYGTNAEVGGQCIKCPSGTNTAEPSNTTNGNTNSSANISVCNQCSQNFYMKNAANTNEPFSSAQCTPCPTGSGSLIVSTTPTDISFCKICLPNYYMTVEAFSPIPGVIPFAAVCIPCPANSSSPVQTQIGALKSCTCFDFNALPFSNSQTTCTCNKGYQGLVSHIKDGPSGCTRCSEDMFSVGGNPCRQCPPGSVILDDQSGCTCYDSSEGTLPWSFSTNTCQCSAGYYGDPSKAVLGTTNSCSPCPSGYTSIIGVALDQNGCYFSGTTFKAVIKFYIKSLAFILVLL